MEYTGNLDIDNAKRKIRKLLALSQSDNIHEAASAAAKAQSMMEQYQIDEAMLQQDQSEDELPPEFTSSDIQQVTIWRAKGRTMPTWAIYLNGHICRVNRCYPFYYPGRRTYSQSDAPDWAKGKACAYGCPPDLEVAATMMDHLAEEVERLYKANKPEGLSRGEGRVWANNFRLGCVAEIGNRLRQAQEQAMEEKARELAYQKAHAEGDAQALLALDAGEETEGMTNALVRIGSAVERLEERRDLVTSYVNENVKLRSSGYRNRRYSSSGYSAGRNAGKSANLGGARRKKLGD